MTFSALRRRSILSLSSASILSIASSISAQTLTYDADPGTAGLQTGSGNWHGTGNWWDGTANVDWSDGSEAVIPSGNTVTIRQATDCATVTLDGTVILQNHAWIVRGNGEGGGTVRSDLPKNPPATNGLVFETGEAVSFAWDIRAHVDFNRGIQVTARGAGTALTYNGFWNHPGGGNRAIAQALDGATFTFGPDAVVNNQQPDWNAREFRLVGDGTGQFIFDPDFDVDMGGTQSNPVGGLSVYRLFNATMVSQTSQNLPQIWKPAGGSVKLHGGLKIIEAPVTVVIDNEPHFFNGGVAYRQDWVLDTQEDLTHTTEGRYETNLDDGFGPDFGVSENTTLRKTGPAKFIMMGDHAYTPGSRYRIDEGTVEMHTDPNYTGDHPNPSPNIGPYLQAEVSATGTLHLFPQDGETYSMASLSLADSGTFHLEGGKAGMSGSLATGPGSHLVLDNGPGVLASGPVLSAGGNVQLDGIVTIREPAGSPLAAGTYPLVGYGTLASLNAQVDASSLSISTDTGFSATLRDNPAQSRVELVLATGGTPLWNVWQDTHFTPVEVSAGLADPGADANRNGVANVIAYGTGADPRAVPGEIPLSLTEAAGVVTLHFYRNPAATDSTLSVYRKPTPGATPEPIASSTRGGVTQSPVSGTTVSESVDGDRIAVQVELPAPAPAAEFYTIEVQLN